MAQASTAQYQMVGRRAGPIDRDSMTSEPFEVLRDALQLESRLRIQPPGYWVMVTNSARKRRWNGYGRSVVLSTTLFGPWTLTVDGDVVVEDASRLEAFRAAANRMREIAIEG